MKIRHLPLVLLFLGIGNQTVRAQLGFSHEIGVITGPVLFQSDYGIRNDFETNIQNNGFGVGLVHYLNFSYEAGCSCYTSYTYFNDHFKLRSEVSWNQTQLDHFGRWVSPALTSVQADRLRAHSGVATNFDVGMQLEYFPYSIRAFSSHTGGFAPFFSLGAHYTTSTPEAYTSFGDGNVFNPNNIYTPWIPHIFAENCR